MDYVTTVESKGSPKQDWRDWVGLLPWSLDPSFKHCFNRSGRVNGLGKTSYVLKKSIHSVINALADAIVVLRHIYYFCESKPHGFLGKKHIMHSVDNIGLKWGNLYGVFLNHIYWDYYILWWLDHSVNRESLVSTSRMDYAIQCMYFVNA